MRSVCAGPVHGIHLIAKGFYGRIDKEAWMAISSATPNNIRGYPVVPCCTLLQQTIRGIRVCQVGAYEVETLC